MKRYVHNLNEDCLTCMYVESLKHIGAESVIKNYSNEGKYRLIFDEGFFDINNSHFIYNTIKHPDFLSYFSLAQASMDFRTFTLSTASKDFGKLEKLIDDFVHVCDLKELEMPPSVLNIVKTRMEELEQVERDARYILRVRQPGAM